jgi:branched-chain amino acid transport system substrate-binding protein
MLVPRSSLHRIVNKSIRLIKLLGAIAITGPVILRGTTANAAASKVIKIGYVSSQTGVFAPFAEAYPFTLDQIGTVLAKGISNDEVSYEIQIITKDSQSNTNWASKVASDSIRRGKVDSLVSSGPLETTNAVADQASERGSSHYGWDSLGTAGIIPQSRL